MPHPTPLHLEGGILGGNCDFFATNGPVPTEAGNHVHTQQDHSSTNSQRFATSHIKTEFHSLVR